MQAIIESLEMYKLHKRPTGGFLHAVLCNDFFRACEKADDINRLSTL